MIKEHYKTITVSDIVKDGEYSISIKGDNCVIGTIEIIVSTNEYNQRTSTYKVCIWSKNISGLCLSSINFYIKRTILPLRYKYGISMTERISGGQKRNRRDGIYKEINFV